MRCCKHSAHPKHWLLRQFFETSQWHHEAQFEDAAAAGAAASSAASTGKYWQCLLLAALAVLYWQRLLLAVQALPACMGLPWLGYVPRLRP